MIDLARVEARDLGAVRLVRVIGEVDLSNAADVMEAVAEAVPGDASHIILDLSETTYLDSTGIAMIFRVAERFGYHRQELRLVVPSKTPIRALFDLTDVNRVIPVHEGIDEVPSPG